MPSRKDVGPSRIDSFEFFAAVHEFVPVCEDTCGKGNLFRGQAVELCLLESFIAIADFPCDLEGESPVTSWRQVLHSPYPLSEKAGDMEFGVYEDFSEAAQLLRPVAA